MSLLEGLMDLIWFDGSTAMRAIPAPRDETLLEQSGLGTKSCADAWCKMLIKHGGTKDCHRIKYVKGNAPWRKPKTQLNAWDTSHDDTKYWKV